MITRLPDNADFVYDEDRGIYVARDLLKRPRVESLASEHRLDFRYSDEDYLIVNDKTKALGLLKHLTPSIPGTKLRIFKYDEYLSFLEWAEKHDDLVFDRLRNMAELLQDNNGNLGINPSGYPEPSFVELSKVPLSSYQFIVNLREVCEK